MTKTQKKSARADSLAGRLGYIAVAGMFVLQILVFLILRDESYPQIHDNLDLFVPHYRMMKLADAWFAHGVKLPVMHGLNRDLFGSEFLLYNVLYILLPDIAAYLIGYFIKIAVGFLSFLLLARDMCGSRQAYLQRRAVLVPVAAAFAMIPVFPTYGIAFTSVPLVIWLIRRIYYGEALSPGRTPDKKWKRALPWICLFVYPCLSYFSYHGFFILSYMCVAVIILWIRDKKFPARVFFAIVVLSLGYVAFEYRLFAAMLLDDTVTIRTTMEHGEISFAEAVKTGALEFVNASFHSEDSHTYLVLPLAALGFLAANIKHISEKRPKDIVKDPVNLILLWIALNCLNFGLYQYAPYRHILETLVPQLTGFEFARTAYFNTFLWYALAAVILCRLAKTKKTVAAAAAVAAALVVMFVPQVYNDLYYTVYNHAYKIVKHKETSTVNYREFYSRELFDRVKDDMDYDGAWSAAYGFHPGILNYNGIASLDGYLGMYPQEYKDKWLEVEKPAFEGSPSLGQYFEDWGARVCLYSGSDENTYAPMRYTEYEDMRLVADMDALRDLDCRYIFSRTEFSNAGELGLVKLGSWDGAQYGSPYEITVYELGGSH